jgi:hypothetical protein
MSILGINEGSECILQVKDVYAVDVLILKDQLNKSCKNISTVSLQHVANAYIYNLVLHSDDEQSQLREIMTRAQATLIPWMFNLKYSAGLPKSFHTKEEGRPDLDFGAPGLYNISVPAIYLACGDDHMNRQYTIRLAKYPGINLFLNDSDADKNWEDELYKLL